jgi:hypothetical protein
VEILIAVLIALMAAGNSRADGFTAQHVDEYQVKAAFLYNFAKFVDWPTETFQRLNEPFTICILGEDPFGRTLDDMVAGKTVGGRSILVRRLPDDVGLRGCQILFVSAPHPKHSPSVLTGANKQSGLLIVGDAGLATAGDTMIGFTMAGGKVRFEIDAASAERAGLHISSRLLSLAQGSGK